MPAANRTSPLNEATRWALRMNDTAGQELRIARIAAGKTQRQVAVTLGTSASTISRRERGFLRRTSLLDVTRHASVVGLRCSVRFYPAYRRPLDAPQLELIARLLRRVHASWSAATEVPMPIGGDLRAADLTLETAACRVVVEAVTRLIDIQAQLRPARLKARDLGAQRVILLVAATHANRRLIRAAGPALQSAFPIRPRDALRALADGRDPGGDALLAL